MCVCMRIKRNLRVSKNSRNSEMWEKKEKCLDDIIIGNKIKIIYLKVGRASAKHKTSDNVGKMYDLIVVR